MVEIRDAVSQSRRFLTEVFGEVDVNGPITLEGVELSEDMKYWFITFSYWSSIKKYKTVKLRAADGLALGVKNSDL